MISPDMEKFIHIQKKRSVRKEELKDKIMSSIKDRIQTYSNLGYTNFVYTIPNFIFGYMPYDLEPMNKYIIKKLINEGFYIKELNVQYIYISWHVNDLLKSKEEKIKYEKIKTSKRNEKSERNSIDNYSAFVNNNKLG